jgi:hypothetical protein
MHTMGSKPFSLVPIMVGALDTSRCVCVCACVCECVFVCVGVGVCVRVFVVAYLCEVGGHIFVHRMWFQPEDVWQTIYRNTPF